ncbi:hypothetical protein FGO68_gene8214 [Halteria grandinella]|uniref:Uncharacterized protein n=1 Tax=Halteria grandinella TaxID=5974 RepID=A0A8J8NEP0_HALGN|nr:hypothetical protein FGO68_gene8214 [Halteria grandinella]
MAVLQCQYNLICFLQFSQVQFRFISVFRLSVIFRNLSPPFITPKALFFILPQLQMNLLYVPVLLGVLPHQILIVLALPALATNLFRTSKALK